MPQPVHRSVPVPGGRVHLVEQGEGPIVLLIHARLFFVEPGGRMSDHFTNQSLPGWLTPNDLDFYTAEFRTHRGHRSAQSLPQRRP